MGAGFGDDCTVTGWCREDRQSARSREDNASQARQTPHTDFDRTTIRTEQRARQDLIEPGLAPIRHAGLIPRTTSRFDRDPRLGRRRRRVFESA